MKDQQGQNVCHFLCLETKKVTKENSRTKEWLRPFVRPTHPWQVERRSPLLNPPPEGRRTCFLKQMVFEMVRMGKTLLRDMRRLWRRCPDASVGKALGDFCLLKIAAGYSIELRDCKSRRAGFLNAISV